MKKQIDGQLNLFDYLPDKIENDSRADQSDKKETKKEKKEFINYFKECIKCWCKDCRHNKELDGKPRDFAGVQSPCPSCTFCVRAKKPEICEMNSYENGCKLRALEEGIEP